jgi:hypothetical protein
MELHYVFPSASAYRLNKCLFLLKSDDTFRQRFRDDPVRAMREVGLDTEAEGALAPFDRDQLVALGAHPYLVFMAGLHLKMDLEPATFEHF